MPFPTEMIHVPAPIALRRQAGRFYRHDQMEMGYLPVVLGVGLARLRAWAVLGELRAILTTAGQELQTG